MGKEDRQDPQGDEPHVRRGVPKELRTVQLVETGGLAHGNADVDRFLGHVRQDPQRTQGRGTNTSLSGRRGTAAHPRNSGFPSRTRGRNARPGWPARHTSANTGRTRRTRKCRAATGRTKPASGRRQSPRAGSILHDRSPSIRERTPGQRGTLASQRLATGRQPPCESKGVHANSWSMNPIPTAHPVQFGQAGRSDQPPSDEV